MKKIAILIAAMVAMMLFFGKDPMEYCSSDPDQGAFLLMTALFAVISTTNAPVYGIKVRFALYAISGVLALSCGPICLAIYVVFAAYIYRYIKSNPDVAKIIKKTIEPEA